MQQLTVMRSSTLDLVRPYRHMSGQLNHPDCRRTQARCTYLCATYCVCDATADCRKAAAEFGKRRYKTGTDSSGLSISSGTGFSDLSRLSCRGRQAVVSSGTSHAQTDTFAASHLNRAVTGAGAVTNKAEAKMQRL